jgi:hypothetical protein
LARLGHWLDIELVKQSPARDLVASLADPHHQWWSKRIGFSAGFSGEVFPTG